MTALVLMGASILLGLVLGLGSGQLALALIFHPRREFRLFGIRLPLTPALFLRLRPTLARLAGDLFTREIRGGELLASRLRDPSLRADLQREIQLRLDDSFSKSASSLFSGIDGGRDATLTDLARRSWAHLVDSSSFSNAMALALGRALDIIEDLPLSFLLPPERTREAAEALFSEVNLGRLEVLVRAWIDRGFSGTGSRNLGAHLVPVAARGEDRVTAPGYVAGIIPTESLEPLIGLLVEGLYTASIPVVERFLNDVDTRRVIELSAVEMVRRAISRLNVVQRLIVGAANYERSIAETMPETVEDLVSMVSDLLRSPKIRTSTKQAARDAWRDYFDSATGSTSLAAFISRESAYEALDSVLELLRGQGPRLAERAAWLVASRADATLGSLLAILGITGAEVAARSSLDLRPLLSLDGRAGQALSKGIEGFLATLLESLGSRPLADLVGGDAALSSELAAWLADRSLELVATESTHIIEGLELRSAIIEKIENMDTIEARVSLGRVWGRISLFVVLALGCLGGLIGAMSGLLYFFYSGR